jgi:hypothetical protein
MRLLKNFLLLMLAAGVTATFTSCDKDDDHDHDHNEITIRILEPKANEKVADASDVHIHIEVEASDENHEVEIKLHPKGDSSDKIIDYDKHTHDKKFVFEQDVDLSSYPAGTVFHLEIEACVDHDCKEKVEKHIDFSI